MSLAADEFYLRGLRPADAKICAFIKIESLVKLADDGRSLKYRIVPRIIQPRNPRLPVFNYALGRFTKAYAPLLKDAVRKVGRSVSGNGLPVILKGLDPRRRARVLLDAWLSYVDPVAVSMDASRFDQHTGIAALVWEASVWAMHCPTEFRAELKNILDMQLRNRGVASCPDGTATYTVNGCRMSGDMNTSDGNCVIMSAMLLSLMHEKGLKGNVINDGDDSLVILEREDAVRLRQGLEEWFLVMGYKMEVEDTVDVFEHIDFCQCHPIQTAGGPLMVRNPHKSCAKDLTHVTNFAQKQDVQTWLAAVGDCGMALTDGVPVLQAFYSTFEPGVTKRIPEELKHRGFYRMARGMKWRGLPVTDEARLSFYKAFGVYPDDQVFLEREWSSMKLRELPYREPQQPNHHPRWVTPIQPRW
jgi:hypothetical protein